jgi:hypothetical protein
MNHETNEVISLRNRFRALKADMDLVHQAWQTAVREHDLDRQVSLMAHEGNLIRETSAVMSAFYQLIAQELMHTHSGGTGIIGGAIYRWMIIVPLGGVKMLHATRIALIQTL